MPKFDQDDDEYWYKCKDCNGEGTEELPEEPPITVTCGGCDGYGVIQGDADDEQNGWVRVPN